MKRVPGVVVLFSLLLVCFDVAALSGNQWKQHSELTRNIYIMGVVDAWRNLEQLEESVKQPPQRSSYKLSIEGVSCISKGMTYGQVGAIVAKYIDNNPSEWQYDMASLAWMAVYKACNSSAR